MSVLSIFLIGLSLSMDAFAISVSNGIACGRDLSKSQKIRQALATSCAFGAAQAVMPLLGYAAGQSFAGFITAVDHWVAFILLAVIGGKMIVEGLGALRNPDENEVCVILTPRLLLVQAVATSIDALAVGIGLAVIQVNIWLAAGLIGCTTLLCCLAGYTLGRYFDNLLKNGAVIAGGLVLVLIGLKILLEHTGVI